MNGQRSTFGSSEAQRAWEAEQVRAECQRRHDDECGCSLSVQVGRYGWVHYMESGRS